MNLSSLGFIEDEHYTKEVNGVLAEITTFRGEHCDEVRVRGEEWASFAISQGDSSKSRSA